MSIQSMRFGGSETDTGPIRSEVDLDRVQELEEERRKNPPLAYVLPLKSLKSLRLHEEWVIDRGVKHKAKQLSKLLLGQKKIPLIDGNFSNPGQLRRSVRTLLANARESNDRNLYLIGTTDELFAELWRGADLKEQRVSQEIPESSAGREACREPCNEPSRLLLELMQPAAIPEELNQAYLGKSVEAQLVRQLIVRGAANDQPVLILGDTGTGKGIIARQIHKWSGRTKADFIPVNCAAIPSELLELELFGCEANVIQKGYPLKRGLWEHAGKGTLFLDEIGDLALDHQTKILRALEEQTIRRIGGLKEIKVFARVVAASNRDLFALVQHSLFRDDLYYRLRGLLIRTPPLRDHLDDVPELAAFYWRKTTGDPGACLPREILSELRCHRWPGNVRELKLLLSTLHAYFGKDRLRVDHLRAILQFEGQAVAADAVSTAAPESEVVLHRVECLRHLKRVDEFLHAVRETLRPFAKDGKNDGVSVKRAKNGLAQRLNELELICRHPLLFHSEQTFTVVYRLKGKLAYFEGLLTGNVESAAVYWEKDVDEELQLVQAAVIKEVERILEKI